MSTAKRGPGRPKGPVTPAQKRKHLQAMHEFQKHLNRGHEERESRITLEQAPHLPGGERLIGMVATNAERNVSPDEIIGALLLHDEDVQIKTLLGAVDQVISRRVARYKALTEERNHAGRAIDSTVSMVKELNDLVNKTAQI